MHASWRGAAFERGLRFRHIYSIACPAETCDREAAPGNGSTLGSSNGVSAFLRRSESVGDASRWVIRGSRLLTHVSDADATEHNLVRSWHTRLSGSAPVARALTNRLLASILELLQLLELLFSSQSENNFLILGEFQSQFSASSSIACFSGSIRSCRMRETRIPPASTR